MKQFPYSDLYKELVPQLNWPACQDQATAVDMLRHLVTAHLQLPMLLHRQGRMTPDLIELFKTFAAGFAQPYLGPDGRFQEELDEEAKSKAQFDLRLFRDFWNQVLHPLYANIKTGLNYSGSIPEVILFRPFGSWLLNGEHLRLESPTATSWELETAFRHADPEDVILEIHTGANYPMLFRSSPRTMIQPAVGSPLADQTHYSVILAPSEYRIMRTCARIISGREVFFLIVRPLFVLADPQHPGRYTP